MHMWISSTEGIAAWLQVKVMGNIVPPAQKYIFTFNVGRVAGKLCTLRPGNYYSFAMAILSQNYTETNIAESILASIKAVIGVFPNNVVIDSMTFNFSLTAGGCRKSSFGSGG